MCWFVVMCAFQEQAIGHVTRFWVHVILTWNYTFQDKMKGVLFCKGISFAMLMHSLTCIPIQKIPKLIKGCPSTCHNQKCTHTHTHTHTHSYRYYICACTYYSSIYTAGWTVLIYRYCAIDWMAMLQVRGNVSDSTVIHAQYCHNLSQDIQLSIEMFNLL